ncbi:MAG: hypothetical protein SGI72_13685 [Planctomycetota bacterium]|nr:hypothetical protein [Planctomycetota bacterium]
MRDLYGNCLYEELGPRTPSPPRFAFEHMRPSFECQDVVARRLRIANDPETVVVDYVVRAANRDRFGFTAMNDGRPHTYALCMTTRCQWAMRRNPSRTIEAERLRIVAIRR